MLLKMVAAAMKDETAKLVVADWLEEFAKQVPELSYYLQLLRTGKPKVIDWLSIIDKFGSGAERKQSQRIQRRVIKCYSRSAKRKKEVKTWFRDDGRFYTAHTIISEQVVAELENLIK